MGERKNGGFGRSQEGQESRKEPVLARNLGGVRTTEEKKTVIIRKERERFLSLGGVNGAIRKIQYA